jgi:hypothetical protein
MSGLRDLTPDHPSALKGTFAVKIAAVRKPSDTAPPPSKLSMNYDF